MPRLTRTFYHASTVPLEPGATLVPGSTIGKMTFRHDHGGMSNRRVCIASTLTDVRQWAKTIGYRNDDVHIYEVSAPGARRYSDTEFRVATATVLRMVDTVPGWQ